VRPEIGDHILELRPTAVVVETACSESHGAAFGNRVTAAELAFSEEEWYG